MKHVEWLQGEREAARSSSLATLRLEDYGDRLDVVYASSFQLERTVPYSVIRCLGPTLSQQAFFVACHVMGALCCGVASDPPSRRTTSPESNASSEVLALPKGDVVQESRRCRTLFRLFRKLAELLRDGCLALTKRLAVFLDHNFTKTSTPNQLGPFVLSTRSIHIA